MEADLKRQIIEDYKKASSYIDKIFSKKRINGLVLKPHQYLSPSICII